MSSLSSRFCSNSFLEFGILQFLLFVHSMLCCVVCPGLFILLSVLFCVFKFCLYKALDRFNVCLWTSGQLCTTLCRRTFYFVLGLDFRRQMKNDQREYASILFTFERNKLNIVRFLEFCFVSIFLLSHNQIKINIRVFRIQKFNIEIAVIHNSFWISINWYILIMYFVQCTSIQVIVLYRCVWVCFIFTLVTHNFIFFPCFFDFFFLSDFLTIFSFAPNCNTPELNSCSKRLSWHQVYDFLTFFSSWLHNNITWFRFAPSDARLFNQNLEIRNLKTK